MLECIRLSSLGPYHRLKNSLAWSYLILASPLGVSACTQVQENLHLDSGCAGGISEEKGICGCEAVQLTKAETWETSNLTLLLLMI